MTIKEVLTKDEKIETGLKMMYLSGIMQDRQRKIRRIYIRRIVMGIILAAISFLLLFRGYNDALAHAGIVFGLIYVFVDLGFLIFEKRIDEYRVRKSIRNNLEVIEKKYDISIDKCESVAVIEDDYVQLDELGSSTRYLKKDYLSNIEDDKFYILEFTNARYIFFKKDSFSGKDEFDKLIAEVEEIG